MEQGEPLALDSIADAIGVTRFMTFFTLIRLGVIGWQEGGRTRSSSRIPCFLRDEIRRYGPGLSPHLASPRDCASLAQGCIAVLTPEGCPPLRTGLQAQRCLMPASSC